MLKILLCAVVLLCVNLSGAFGVVYKDYAMYVWTTSFDKNVPGCNETRLLEWDKKSRCFTHSWDTPQKREWLWNTCSLPLREITAIFLSGTHHALRDAYNYGNCRSDAVQMITQTLIEGHRNVRPFRLSIYALYAVSDLAVSEQSLVKYVVFYNDVCAKSIDERFDGVATNNEAYAPIKCGDMSTRIQYLNDLRAITTEAGKQQHGRLLAHYSISWHWGKCDHGNMMTWNGKTQDAAHHMIDIFDSVDVQVGYTTFPQISSRLKLAGYDYAKSIGKKIYATMYLSKTSPCQITFFPQTCTKGGHTESAMFDTFDDFDSHGIGYASPCIHYFRGVYSSGVHPDWPAHDRHCIDTCDENLVVG